MQSIIQIASLIKKNRDNLQQLINDLEIPPINQKQDVEKSFVTVDKIIESIPDNETLKGYKQSSTKLKKQLMISNYDGNYKIVNRAKERLNYLKQQARDAYYLMALLKLPRQCNQFEKLQCQSQIKLKSYQLMLNQDTKKNRIQKKNSIIQNYFLQLKKEQQDSICKIQQSVRKLNRDDFLINVAVYDSINSYKTQQIIFLGDHNLMKLKQKIQCVIQKLQLESYMQKKQQNHKYGLSQLSDNCFLLIQDRIYLSGSQKNNQYIDKIIHNLQTSYSTSILKFQMNKTFFKDLRVVFGKSYTFRHIGGCDHTIVFKQVRLFDQKLDLSLKNKYPLQVYEGKMKIRKCQGCQTKNAQYVSLCDFLKKGQNLYLCSQCYNALDGDQQNQKQTFKKIRYIHD